MSAVEKKLQELGITLPTPAGEFSARGSMTSPYDWRAMLGLRREF